MKLRSGKQFFSEDWDTIVEYATIKANNHFPKPVMIEGLRYEDGLVGNAYLEIPKKAIINPIVADGIEKKYIIYSGTQYLFLYPYFSQSFEKNTVFMESVKNRLKEYDVKTNLIKYLD